MRNATRTLVLALGQAAGGEERATGAEDHRPHAP